MTNQLDIHTQSVFLIKCPQLHYRNVCCRGHFTWTTLYMLTQSRGSVKFHQLVLIVGISMILFLLSVDSCSYCGGGGGGGVGGGGSTMTCCGKMLCKIGVLLATVTDVQHDGNDKLD